MDRLKMMVFGATAGTAVMLVVMTAAPADAAGQDGTLHDGEFGFYYNSGCNGSMSDFATRKADLAGYKFLSGGAGQNTPVKNNSACAANARSTQNARVYFNSNYLGANDLIPADQYGNLTNTYNENASFRWLG
ncbi:hypothetical protein NODU109028_09260 [Nocardioides dubius]|uniref:Peptidase inhibitor family I36 protein n=1 Tax=Nocardioides dubius TaxID=317019 RepID=A0ABP4ECK3_9ACTN